MSLDDREHVAWRILVDAQAERTPGDPRELGRYLDERIAEAGGARGLVLGLMTAAAQTIRATAQRHGEEPLAVAERLRDAHAVEHMDSDFDEDN